jgi:hypothetical protein
MCVPVTELRYQPTYVMPTEADVIYMQRKQAALKAIIMPNKAGAARIEQIKNVIVDKCGSQLESLNAFRRT